MTRSTRSLENELSAAIAAVAMVGIVIGVLAGVLSGSRALLGTGLGSLLATLNLWVIARIGRAFISPRGTRLPWSLIALTKFSVLFGAVYLLVSRGWVDTLPLLIGYAALPVGIVAAQLRSAPARGGMNSA
jgi:hypothetical protein